MGKESVCIIIGTLEPALKDIQASGLIPTTGEKKMETFIP